MHALTFLMQEFVKAVEGWRQGRSGSSDRIQALVASLKQGYAQRAAELREEHDRAVAQLRIKVKLYDLVGM